MIKLPQTIANLAIGILLVNVIGLWTVQLMPRTNIVDSNVQQYIAEPTDAVRTADVSTTTSAIRDAVSPSIVSSVLSRSQDDQIEELQAQLDQLKNTVSTLSTQARSTRQSVVSVTSASSVKEQYVFLGTGKTTNREWTRLTGTQTTLNRNNYGKIKEVTFQAALATIGGEAQARLVNKTTGAIITLTEVSHNTPQSTWKVSPAFELSSGNNEYIVELRSTSGDLAELTGARLKIVEQ